jgi:CheY-like chemotaxis protein
VSIPLIHDESAAEPKVKADDTTAQNLSILVVDDNVDAANSIAILLKAIGHQAVVATSAKDAISEAALKPFDVFILDIGLPDMTGYDLAKALRKRPNSENETYIALTGYGQPQDRQLSKEAGFAHHFVKPVNNQLLFKVLAEVKSASTRA